MARTKATVLAELRKHKKFRVVLATINVDRAEWRTNDLHGEEEYPGEAAEWLEAYDLLMELLTGKRA